MPIASGTKIGPYEIIEKVGAGGMGEVYRARDPRLKREVALKVLPQDFASDPERMARFEREAQLLASLNHPNIASIYGLEESGRIQAFVMELVQGTTLGERIAMGPIPPREALAIGHQIAEALEYAHERGVVHRDLKPFNVKLGLEDSVKVLDFGLAKALADDSALSDSSTSPTITAIATREGMILGTAPYMSPEQARARAADRRADIWAFGCVLFEMLTGKLAFPGETTSDTLAAVLTKEPKLQQLPASTPASIHRLIGRCLQKDIKKRLQAIGDARIDIEDCLAGGDGQQVATPLPDRFQDRGAKGTKGRWSGVAIFTAALFLVVAAVLMVWRIKSQPTVGQDWIADMLGGPTIAMGPRLSPDGHTLAFQAMVGNITQVAVTSPDAGNWTLLTHDREHGFVNEISWAPDGSKLYYDRTIGVPVAIYSVPALGGAERLVLEQAGSPEALPDGSLLVIRPDRNARWRIYHFWPDSQRLEPLGGWVSIATTTPLRVFPDGREAVFNGMASESDPLVHLYVVDIATGKTRRLAADLPDRRISESYPIAPSADNLGVLVEVPAGDLHRIVFVPRNSKLGIQTVMTLTKPPWYLESAKDGTLYLDQVDRPHEILCFPVAGGQPEILGSSDTYVPAGQYAVPVETTDGRFLLDTVFSGRGRFLIAKPGGDFVPVLDIDDETSSPATSLENNQIAFVLGRNSAAMVVIASASEGRIVRWLQGTKGRHITALGASPDSKTIYFGADGYIWSIPADDGSPQKIADGDDVSVDPNGHELIVARDVASSPVLTKVSIDSGKAEPVPVEKGHSLAPVAIGARAINRQGKMLITISPADSWFYRAAVLDLRTGQVTPIKVSYGGDTLSSNWAADGKVISVGLPLKSHIWRFQPAAK
jgi:eukaryotic-like serine/threonine-protein kinase